MEIQWPLLIFSVLLGVTSGSFVFLAVGELRGKFREVRFSGALIALICLAVGGCVSVLHMGHPERATHLLGNLGSGLSKELFVVAIMGIIALVYLVLAKKDYPGVSKVFGILGGVIGLVLSAVAATVMAILGNLVITPMWLGVPLDAVVAMILPILTPFNLAKAGINAVLTLIVYKSISNLITPKKKQVKGR